MHKKSYESQVFNELDMASLLRQNKNGKKQTLLLLMAVLAGLI
jgi:hypothetical protein